MQAEVAIEQDVVIVRLSGYLDFETAEPFRKVCFNQLMGRKVVFDFRSLGFVGSSGILPFVEIFREFAERNPAGFKLSGMSTEFRQIFSTVPMKPVEIYEDAAQAVNAFIREAATVAPQAGEPAPILASDTGSGGAA